MSAGLDIVVVNWNGGTMLAACVASVQAAARPDDGWHVIVVDNASTDDSLAQVDALPTGPARVTILRNAANRGFAAACNQGAAAGTATHVLFLNPDTEVTRDALVAACASLGGWEAAGRGIVGVQLRESDGRIARSCARFPSPRGILGGATGLDRLAPAWFPPHFMVEWDHADSRDVDQVMGAFFLVPRALFTRLGGFDERYFVYYEEVDFCRRALDAGFRTHYLATVHVTHHGQGTTRAIKARRWFYVRRSRLLYARAHFSPAGRLVAGLATRVLEPIAAPVWGLLRGRGGDALGAIGGAWLLWTRGTREAGVAA